MLPLLAAALIAASPSTTVVGLLNQERAAHGVASLHANAKLAKAARKHSHEMVVHHRFSHGGFRGPGRRGQNLAWGEGEQATPQAIVNAWMASPPHRATLLNPAYHEVGVGIAAGVPSG